MIQIDAQPENEDLPKIEEKEEKKDYADDFVAPHSVISRPVEEKDLERVMEDGKKMVELCHVKVGNYPAGFAVAHPQITKEDPLRFYAMYDGQIIINPEIVRHSEYTKNEVEGCLSYGRTMPIRKDRYRIVEMEYNELQQNADGEISLSERRHVRLKDREARIVQHETEHFESIYLYPLEPTNLEK